MTGATTLAEESRITEIGLLPRDWGVVKLGDVLREVNIRVGEAFKVPVLSMTRHEGLVLQQQKFDKRVASRDISKYKVVHRGDIVYGFPMDEGVIYKLRNFDKGAVSPVYEVWKLISESVDSDYLDQTLRSPLLISTYEKLTSSVVERRRIVSKRDFQEIRIPLPSLAEQRKIAYALSTVQTAIEKTKIVIKATRELKKSLMKHLFTYGPVNIDETERVPLKETEIGLVPEEWEMERLGDSIKEAQYGLSLKGTSQAAFPILRMNNLVDGQINTSNLQYVDLDEVTFKHFKLEKGDILFNRTNSQELVGKAALFDLDRNFVFASYLIRVVPESYLLIPHYLNYYLNWGETQIRLRMLASRGVSQSNVSATKLRGLLILRPPIPVQQSITENLYALDRKIQVEESKKKALEALFKTMLSNLMTGRMRVNNLEVPI